MLAKLMSAVVLVTQLISGATDRHVFGIDGRSILCVPESDMDPLLLRYADESTHLQIGSGHTPGFSFLFRPELMKSLIPEYAVIPGFEGHPYVNALSGTIGFLGPDDEMRLGSAMRARNIDDEWYARNACRRPVVRSLPRTAMYEVKCDANADYSTIWNRMPEPQLAMPNPNEFVVATCHYESIRLGPYKGRELKNCARIVKFQQFLMDYRFQEENLRAVPKIDSFLRAKLTQWERNCSTRT